MYRYPEKRTKINKKLCLFEKMVIKHGRVTRHLKLYIEVSICSIMSGKHVPMCLKETILSNENTYYHVSFVIIHSTMLTLISVK